MLEIAEVVRFHVSESVNLYPCLDLAGLKSFKAFAVIGAGVLGLRSFATIVYTGDQLSLASLRTTQGARVIVLHVVVCTQEPDPGALRNCCKPKLSPFESSITRRFIGDSQSDLSSKCLYKHRPLAGIAGISN